MNSRGNMQQVFIYILAILVIGFIMLVGVKSFAKIKDGTCKAERVTFQRDLTKVLETNDVWGREEIVGIQKPCDYEAVCFADAKTIKWNQKNPGAARVLVTTYTNHKAPPLLYNLPAGGLVIKDSVDSGIEKNIFIIRKGIVEPIDYDEKIELPTTDSAWFDPKPYEPDVVNVPIPKYVLCIPALAGKFSFTLQGQGKSVKIVP
jgi:hypothetical protein